MTNLVGSKIYFKMDVNAYATLVEKGAIVDVRPERCYVILKGRQGDDALTVAILDDAGRRRAVKLPSTTGNECHLFEWRIVWIVYTKRTISQ